MPVQILSAQKASHDFVANNLLLAAFNQIVVPGPIRFHVRKQSFVFLEQFFDFGLCITTSCSCLTNWNCSTTLKLHIAVMVRVYLVKLRSHQVLKHRLAWQIISVRGVCSSQPRYATFITGFHCVLRMPSLMQNPFRTLGRFRLCNCGFPVLVTCLHWNYVWLTWIQSCRCL